jgi:hypothetical protein
MSAICFSDIDGTLVHEPEHDSLSQGDAYLWLPLSSSGQQVILALSIVIHQACKDLFGIILGLDFKKDIAATCTLAILWKPAGDCYGGTHFDTLPTTAFLAGS